MTIQLLDIVLLSGGIIDQFITWILHHGGLFFLLFIVFAETGLFVGFFLPGDSLLFAAGIYLRNQPEGFYNIDPFLVALMIILASVIGNMVGYWFGWKAGPYLFQRKDTWIYKKKHLYKAKEFYDKYGRETIFLAKFLPVVRTFAPIVAGIVKMDKGIFILYNFLGSIAWVVSMVLGGYYLEAWMVKQFNFSLTDHIEKITIAIILITTTPILYKLFFAKKHVVPRTDDDPNSVL